MVVLATARLSLRELELADAPFVLELVNEPLWLRFIGDRGVRTLDDARRYVESGPRASYAAHGFGLWLVERSADRVALGICGLIQRDFLPEPDLGFAFLERFHGRGFAVESARAVLDRARTDLAIERVLAITLPDNSASIRVLETCGMRFERPLVRDGETLSVYATV